jgi:hypothetical protein
MDHRKPRFDLRKIGRYIQQYARYYCDVIEIIMASGVTAKI